MILKAFFDFTFSPYGMRSAFIGCQRLGQAFFDTIAKFLRFDHFCLRTKAQHPLFDFFKLDL